MGSEVSLTLQRFVACREPGLRPTLKKVAAKGGALEDRLHHLILLQRFREILVHLGLNTLLSVAKHSVCRESDDG